MHLHTPAAHANRSTVKNCPWLEGFSATSSVVGCVRELICKLGPRYQIVHPHSTSTPQRLAMWMVCDTTVLCLRVRRRDIGIALHIEYPYIGPRRGSSSASHYRAPFLRSSNLAANCNALIAIQGRSSAHLLVRINRPTVPHSRESWPVPCWTVTICL